VPVEITSLVGQPANGEPIEIQGVGDAGETVALYADGGPDPVGSGVIDSNGQFDIATSTSFADGQHTLTAIETDANGVSSDPSPGFSVGVNPSTPALTSLVGNPTNGGAIEVQGTGEAGETVTLYADGRSDPVGSGVVDSSGQVDIVTSATFADGQHALTAVQTNADSLSSAPSSAFAVGVSPNPPAITTLVGAPVNGGSIEVQGTGEAGETVTLYADGGTTAVGSGVVDSGGQFDIVTSAAFADGQHTLTAVQTDTDGLSSAPSSGFAVGVDPNAPAITTLVGQPINGGSIEVQGTGEVGETVTLYADGGTTAVGSGVVGSGGQFDIVTSATFADGKHTLTAVQTDADGLSSAPSSGFAVAVDPGAPTISSAGGLTNQPAQTISGTASLADVGTTITVLEGGQTLATATVAADGGWSAQVTLSGDGPHDLSVIDTDADGLASAPSAISFTLDTTAPNLSAPATLVMGQGQAALVTGLGLTESGTPAGETFTVSVSAGAGVLTDTADGVTGSGTNSLSIQGDLAQVQAALAALSLIEASPGSDTLTLAATESNGANTGPLSVAVTTNGPPSLAAPAKSQVTLGAASAVAGFSLSETGATAGESFTVTLTDANGLLSASGSGITGAGTTKLAITGSLSQVNAALASLTDNEASGADDLISLSVSDSLGNASKASTTILVGQTFVLGPSHDQFTGVGNGDDLVITTASNLSSGDVLVGGGGVNTLELSGGGSFKLTAPTSIKNFQRVTVTEGSGTSKPTVQLRNGLNIVLTVNSTPGGGVTIKGANDASVINLGAGVDQVFVGSVQETVHGGAGPSTIFVGPSTIGAAIDGGTGFSTLQFSGGTGVMGANITNIKQVKLQAPSVFTTNNLGGPASYSQLTTDIIALQIPTSLTVKGSTGNDVITAGGPGQVLTGNGGADTLISSAAGGDIFYDTNANLSLDTIQGFSAPGDVIVFSQLQNNPSHPSSVSFANGVLTVTTYTGTSVNVHLDGSFDPTGFHLLQDYDNGSIGEDQNGVDPPGDDQAMVVYTPTDAPNVPPTVTTPSASSATVNVATLLSGISISDSDAYAFDEAMTVTITDKLGTLNSSAKGGNEVKVAGTKKVILSGTLDQVNYYLTTISYLASSAGVDTISITANDNNGGTGGASYSMTVGAAMSASSVQLMSDAMASQFADSLGAQTGAWGGGQQTPLNPALLLVPNPAAT
jgi:hypothetical protein